MPFNRLAAASFLATAVLVAHQAPAEERSVALARVAEQLGYTYNYLGSDDAVTLTRPGLTILVRPGERFYDVNERSEIMEHGAAPRFFRSDVYVSPEFIRRLTFLANHAAGGAGRDAGLSSAPIDEPMIQSGTITMDVKQVPGEQELSVSGHAPPHAPITLTLRMTAAFDVPDVVVSRNGTSADDQGNFDTTISIAPAYFTGAYLTVDATSVAGVTKASKRLVFVPPNTGVDVPADRDQKSIR